MPNLQGFKTILGILVAAVPTISSLFGYHVSSGFAGQFSDLVDQIIVIIGLGIALYGRLVAVVPGWFAKVPPKPPLPVPSAPAAE